MNLEGEDLYCGMCTKVIYGGRDAYEQHYWNCLREKQQQWNPHSSRATVDKAQRKFEARRATQIAFQVAVAGAPVVAVEGVDAGVVVEVAGALVVAVEGVAQVLIMMLLRLLTVMFLIDVD